MGASSNNPLIISGPVMIIQNKGNIEIENVTFMNPENYLIPNRNILVQLTSQTVILK